MGGNMQRFIAIAASLLTLATGAAVADQTVDATRPPWAQTDWMAHDTTMRVQMAYRYAQSYDYVNAFKNLMVAAQRGYPQAQAQIGFYYQNGQGGVGVDNIEAVKWYMLSGDATAAHYAGELRKEMTGEQTAEAEARIKAWSPTLE